MKKAFWRLGCLALAGITATLISVKIAQAQRNSLTVKDANGKEVIVYQDSHALVIWAGDYKNWGKLNNVQNEAKDVVRELQKQGFQVNVIANPNGNQLSNGTKNFIDAYGYLPNNRLVIFFAGHGHTRQQTKGYLVPVDAPDPIVDERGFLKAALSMEQINSWASQMEAKHVLFVFDSCFSGTIFKQRSNSGSKDAYIQDVMNKPVRQFLTAGDADEKVPAKSVFTPLFLRALEGAADFTKDGYVTGSELGIYLRQDLSHYTKTQTPQFGTIRDSDLDQGDIVFKVPKPIVTTNPLHPESNPSPSSPTPSHRSSQLTPLPIVTLPKSALSNPPNQPRSLLISSSTGVDYTPLRELLSQKKWKEADQKTADLMLAAANRQNEGWIDENSANKFSCEDLRMMDREWLVASGGKFGFSVQLAIYKQTGKPFGSYTKALDDGAYDWRFGNLVGWRKDGRWTDYSKLTWDTDAPFIAPQGHLPWGWFVSWRWWLLGFLPFLRICAVFIFCIMLVVYFIFLSHGENLARNREYRLRTDVFERYIGIVIVCTVVILPVEAFFNGYFWGSYHQSASARPNIYLAAVCKL